MIISRNSISFDNVFTIWRYFATSQAPNCIRYAFFREEHTWEVKLPHKKNEMWV